MTGTAPAAARPPSLAEQAYQHLEHDLVTLDLAPGAVVSEGLLIERVGLGRTPVREAIQRLAHQDLIRVMPRKGLMIVPIEQADLLQVLEVRKGLERLIVRLAALMACSSTSASEWPNRPRLCSMMTPPSTSGRSSTSL